MIWVDFVRRLKLKHPALNNFRAQQGLLSLMVRREIASRYRGSMLGVLWSLLTPLMMLAVYTFVFSFVFKARWGAAASNAANEATNAALNGRGGFAVVLFSGLLIHAFFAECLTRAPSMILSNSSYVKRVVFPLEILPVVCVGSALFNCVISLLVLFMFMLLFAIPIHATVLLIPLVLLPLLLLALGASWLLAALGVYVRDVAQLMGMVVTLLMFLAPVFYPITTLPANLRPWLYLNPLTYIIEAARAVLIFGEIPDWRLWCMALLVGLLCAIGGFWSFQKSRGGFADVI